MQCMSQEGKNVRKDKAKVGGDHLTPNIVHMPLCMCISGGALY